MCIDKPDSAAEFTFFPARSSLDDWGVLIYDSDTVEFESEHWRNHDHV